MDQWVDQCRGNAAQLEPFEKTSSQKLAVMLPRNPDKPQSAGDSFRAFALGQVAGKPDERGQLLAWGPFYQWGAVAIVGDPKRPELGITMSGWELVEIFNGLDFALPHDPDIAGRLLRYLKEHAPADFWGFRTALEAANRGSGRTEVNDYFGARLPEDFSDVEWKGSVAESVASGYISRSRAWGLIEPKLRDKTYWLTSLGEKFLSEFSSTAATA